MGTSKNCLNCESEFGATFAYCPFCGQKANDELTMKVLFSQTISNYFSLDARFFKSYIPLLFKPGVVARRYVDGKRLQYLHPAQFYLFVSVIFFFLFSLVTRQQQQEFDTAIKRGFETELKTPSMDSEDLAILREALVTDNKTVLDSISKKLRDNGLVKMDSIPVDTMNIAFFGFTAKKSSLDSLIAINAPKKESLAIFGISEESGGFTQLVGSQFLKIYEQRGGGILKSFYDTIPVSMFFLLPIFALILQLLYFRRGSFAHHMVFSFYYFSFLFMVLCFLAFLNLVTEVPVWLDVLIFMSTIIYLVLALRKFYQQGLMRTLLKTTILSFAYFTFVVPISIVFMLFISFLLY